MLGSGNSDDINKETRTITEQDCAWTCTGCVCTRYSSGSQQISLYGMFSLTNST